MVNEELTLEWLSVPSKTWHALVRRFGMGMPLSSFSKLSKADLESVRGIGPFGARRISDAMNERGYPLSD